MYSFHFNFEIESMEGVKAVNLTLAQIFEDERVDFKCYYEMKEETILFFGLHQSEVMELMIQDAALMDDLSMYAHLCEEGIGEFDESEIDARIKKYSFEEFMNSLDPDEFETPEESQEKMDMLYDMSFFMGEENDDDEEEFEEFEEEAVENSNGDKSVMIDPNLLMNMDEQAVSDMNEYVLENMEGGQDALVMDGNSLEDMFMQMFEDPEFLQQEMKPMLKERLIRKV